MNIEEIIKTDNKEIIEKSNLINCMDDEVNDIESSKEYNGSNDKLKKRKKAKIISEAYPKNKLGELMKQPALAEIHKIIADNNISIEKDKISYEILSLSDYEELVYLHREWFPVKYSKDFFERILNTKNLPDLDILKEADKTNNNKQRKKRSMINENNDSSNYINTNNQVISMGAYLNYKSKKYLIGCVTCEIYNHIYFENACFAEIEHKSEIKNFSNYIYNKQLNFAYIMTIGVVNEARRLGVSSQLLIEMKEYLGKHVYNCQGFYLHVIDYNNSAMNFYLKRGFVNQRTVYNYYNLDDQVYNGIVLYKLFDEAEMRRRYNEHNYKGILRKTYCLGKEILGKIVVLPFTFICYLSTFCGCWVCRKLTRKKVIKIE